MLCQPIPVTVILAVKNEAKNLNRCLSSLQSFSKIYVVDSSSNDGSIQIAEKFNAEVVQFAYFGGYPKKRQWAISSLPISTRWTLLLDADEFISPLLLSEIKEVVSRPSIYKAFYIKKQFHFLGKCFKFGGFSHKAILLFSTGVASFEELVDDSTGDLDMEVHERILVNGKVGALASPLVHEDFKGLDAYIDRHNKYSTWEARLRFKYFSSAQYGDSGISANIFGDVQQRRRFLKLIAIRIPFESWAWFIYHYFLRLGFLEGRPGLIASQIRASYISQVRAKIYELKKNARL